MTDLVATWTGWHADALRQALRMNNEEVAGHLDVAVRTVVYWRTRPDRVRRAVEEPRRPWDRRRRRPLA